MQWRLTALARRYGRGGSGVIERFGTRALAKMCGVPRATFFRGLKRLEAKGWLRRTHTTRPWRGLSRNRYLIRGRINETPALKAGINETPVTRPASQDKGHSAVADGPVPLSRAGSGGGGPPPSPHHGTTLSEKLAQLWPTAPAPARAEWIALSRLVACEADAAYLVAKAQDMARTCWRQLRQPWSAWSRWAIHQLVLWDAHVVPRMPAWMRARLLPGPYRRALPWHSSPNEKMKLEAAAAAAAGRSAAPPAPSVARAAPEPREIPAHVLEALESADPGVRQLAAKWLERAARQPLSLETPA